ncbi:hypothetical protein, partial [Photorhabdus thracensis]|uniref:hypothetical protein n=1 Tax=Photorhabdus thracensis TaxID=230089 RepID=UPI001E4BB0AB
IYIHKINQDYNRIKNKKKSIIIYDLNAFNYFIFNQYIIKNHNNILDLLFSLSQAKNQHLPDKNHTILIIALNHDDLTIEFGVIVYLLNKWDKSF